MEGFGVFGGDDESAWIVGDEAVAGDYMGYLGAGLGGGDDGTAAGEHACELGGHDEVCGSGTLGEEVDVGGVEEVVEAGEGLKRQQGYVAVVSYEGFELGSEGSVSAEEEVNAGIGVGASGGEGGGERREKFEALLGSHVAGVEENYFFFQA